MARRSARIAGACKRTTASPAPRMGSVFEDGEPSETPTTTRRLDTIASSPMAKPTTPSLATPVKLPMSEMHPSKAHPTTAAPSSGTKLGFVDIDYTRTPAEQIALARDTPSKTPSLLPSSAFTFRKTLSTADNALSPETKKMMEAIRDHGARIKADLVAQSNQARLDGDESCDARKIRRAKGKMDRFSAVHIAEFKKMDSIENHPSVLRNASNRNALKAGVKRSQSNADLENPDSVQSAESSSRPAPAFSETQDRPDPESAPVKRMRQRAEDDASALRPVSRDGGSIPQPKSSGNDSFRSGIPRSQALASAMTPTKASLARAKSIKTLPTTNLAKSVSKPDLSGLFNDESKPDLAGLIRSSSKKASGGLKKSVTASDLSAPTHVQTPGRFDKVKSLFKKFTGPKPKSNIPQLTATPSKTSLHPGVDNELPPVPLTAPARKPERHVNFTPRTKPPPELTNTPSPVKSSLPLSKAMAQRLPTSASGKLAAVVGKPAGEKAAPSSDEVAYPDLSAYCRNIGENASESPEKPGEKPGKAHLPASVPGTFTFRSDHTIRFDCSSPRGFGAAAGQASVRQVRHSVLPGACAPVLMPGSFPRLAAAADAASASPNKENQDPGLAGVGVGIPHGMSNKKRHRTSWAEEEAEAAQQERGREQDEGGARAAKKARREAPLEGHAVVAPRLVAAGAAALCSPDKKKVPAPLAATPSPLKKKRTGGLTRSRLNMLARPKIRK
ncbi:hypothetical protein GGS23DRAFT_619104 [Durotheca rogersii]|uniref:uncharacterized protein n=1 Tax=Durotheca rogersii TaxID=419775 RepID=UPI00221F7978|nr:uncharacterized protein GGS23DRAFT_619104 [Durotheca rogersii]KAI5864512.1 hypothetical protein GGS23DRAFT_619104 [Durotheca rogersii]